MTPGGVATLLGAGGVVLGVARRLRERAAQRAGRRLPAARLGPLANELAHWVPAPPTSDGARLASAAWAGPLTTVGALLAGIGGARVRWDEARGCWVATGVRGPSGWMLARLGFDANTIGHVVLVRGDTPSAALLDHEAVHVRQAEQLGPLLPLLYGACAARYGYRDNPLEQAARRGARERPGPTARP